MKLTSSSLLYFLVLGSTTVNPATCQMRCPGKLIDDRYYISSKSELEPLSRLNNISYAAYCHFSDGKYSNETLSPPNNSNAEKNSTAKIQSEYYCDFGTLGKCDGYLINQDYVFWKNDTQQFVDSPKCDTVTSCEQAKGVCVDGTDVCGGGEYACKSKTTNDWCKGQVIPEKEAPACPKFVSSCDELLIEGGGSFHTCDCTIDRGSKYDCHDDHRACNGTFVRKWSCPPAEVSDVNEALKFCPPETIRDLRDSFVCVWANEVVCSGYFTDPIAYDDDWIDVVWSDDIFIDVNDELDEVNDELDETYYYDEDEEDIWIIEESVEEAFEEEGFYDAGDDLFDDDDYAIDSTATFEVVQETKPVYVSKEDQILIVDRQDERKKRGLMMPLFLICIFVGGGAFLYHRTKGNGNVPARRYSYSGLGGGSEYELGDVEGSQNAYRAWQ